MVDYGVSGAEYALLIDWDLQILASRIPRNPGSVFSHHLRPISYLLTEAPTHTDSVTRQDITLTILHRVFL